MAAAKETAKQLSARIEELERARGTTAEQLATAQAELKSRDEAYGLLEARAAEAEAALRRTEKELGARVDETERQLTSARAELDAERRPRLTGPPRQ